MFSFVIKTTATRNNSTISKLAIDFPNISEDCPKIFEILQKSSEQLLALLENFLKMSKDVPMTPMFF